MMRSLAASQRQCVWVVMWHAADSTNHAKPVTGHWTLQLRIKEDSLAQAMPVLHLCFYTYRS